MADNLQLRVKIDTSQADRALERLYSSMSKIDKALNGSSNGFKKLSSDAKQSASSIENVGRSAGRTRDQMSTLGRASSTASGIMQAGFRNASTVLGHLGRTAATVAGILGGFSVAKVANDYVSFSKQVGIMNATLGASPSKLKEVQNEMLVLSAKTGTNAVDSVKTLTQLFSSAEFDPTKGGKFSEGTAEYDANMKVLMSSVERMSMLASSTGTSMEDVQSAFVKFPGALGLPISSIDDANHALDLMKGLLDNSQGELSELIPEIAKFGPTMRQVGIGAEDGLAIFSALTEVFDPAEAGTRANAFAKFMSGSVDVIRKTGKLKVGKRDMTDVFFQSDPATGKKMLKNHLDILSGIRGTLEGTKDDFERLNIMSAIFGEIREESSVLNTYKNLDKLRGISKNLSSVQGEVERGYKDSLTPGMRFTHMLEAMNVVGVLGADALVDIVGNLGDMSKIDLSGFSGSMEAIATALDQKMGKGIGNIVRGIQKFIEYLASAEGQQKIESLVTGVQKLAGFLERAGGALINVLSNPTVSSFIDWALSNPELSIAMALVGIPAIQAALSAAFLAAASGIGPVLGGVIAGAWGLALANPLAAAALAGALILGVQAVQKFEEEKEKMRREIGDGTKAQKSLATMGENMPAAAKGFQDSIPIMSEYMKKLDEARKKTEEFRSYSVEKSNMGDILGYNLFGMGGIADRQREAEKAMAEVEAFEKKHGITASQRRAAQNTGMGYQTNEDKAALASMQRDTVIRNASTRIGQMGAAVVNPMSVMPAVVRQAPQIVQQVQKGGLGGGMDVVKGLMAPIMELQKVPKLDAAIQTFSGKAAADMEAAKSALVSASSQMVSTIQAGVANLQVNATVSGGGGGGKGAHSPSGNSASLSGFLGKFF